MSRSLTHLSSATRCLQPIPSRSSSVLAPVVEATRKSQDTSDDSRFARHLNAQLSPLTFPPELARRILTHASHKKAPIDGHNARMSFIGISLRPRCPSRAHVPFLPGRRVLNSYMTLFLASSPVTDPSHDFEEITARALNTYALGQHVAPKLQLSRVLRWQPAGPTGGLYKVMGEAVQAIVGGTYHQFVSTSNFRRFSGYAYSSCCQGASVTHRLFHQRILPALLIHGPLGLHEAYHADAFNRAKTVCEGAEGGLVWQKGNS